MKRLFLIRGLPGSGKSTLAEALGYTTLEADDFFYDDDGIYKFDASKLREAHAYCQTWAADFMRIAEIPNLIVSNTFTQNWELEPYLKLAARHGYQVTILTVESGLSNADLAARCQHGCPEEKIGEMRARWEEYVDHKYVQEEAAL